MIIFLFYNQYQELILILIWIRAFSDQETSCGCLRLQSKEGRSCGLQKYISPNPVPQTNKSTWHMHGLPLQYEAWWTVKTILPRFLVDTEEILAFDKH